MPFTFEKTHISGVIIIKPRVFKDSRGFFFESYKKSEFMQNGISVEFVQDNVSRSDKGVFRGLHYQIEPAEQGKLVRCSRGRIVDIAVDIRRNSITFKQYVMIELSAADRNMVYIPPGFAHGFYALDDGSQVHYKITSEYNPALERGIIWNDPDIGIKLPASFSNPLLSEKDSVLPALKDAQLFA
jgi:dTDP-4-dehydrorhamnose 3,5-epimerase